MKQRATNEGPWPMYIRVFSVLNSMTYYTEGGDKGRAECP